MFSAIYGSTENVTWFEVPPTQSAVNEDAPEDDAVAPNVTLWDGAGLETVTVAAVGATSSVAGILAWS